MSGDLVVASVRVTVDAPDWFVWNVLVDYANYPQWNPYTVRVDTTFRIGDPIDLHLPMMDGSPGTFVNREYLRVIDAPRHLRYDTAGNMPGLLAARDQWIEPVGPDRCTYHTTDTMSGERAGYVVERTGAWIKAGFDAVAHALKARAEQLWTSRPELESVD